MALIATVTKGEVKKVDGSKDFSVTINVSIEDDVLSEIVFTKEYSQRYNSDSVIGDIRTAFQDMIQADWDKYIGEKNIYDAAAFDTMISQIQAVANTYVNS